MYACIFTHILNTYAILIYIYILVANITFCLETSFIYKLVLLAFFRRPAVYIIYTLVSPIDAKYQNKKTHALAYIYNTYMAIYLYIYIGTYNFHISHKYITLYTHIYLCARIDRVFSF